MGKEMKTGGGCSQADGEEGGGDLDDRKNFRLGNRRASVLSHRGSIVRIGSSVASARSG